MIPRLRRQTRLLVRAACAGLACTLLAGCIDRRFIITTEPNISPTDQSVTKVLINERPVGVSPVDKQWLYNGTYRITLIKDGYETTVINQPVPPKWYEIFPLDFAAENLLPFMIRDVRTFNYTLKPLQIVPPEIVRDAADNLRVKGRAIGTPLPPGAVPVPIPLPEHQPVPGVTTSQQQPGPAPAQPAMMPAALP